MASTRRSGVAPPRLGARQDHATGVEDARPARPGSTRRSALFPTPRATRKDWDTSGDDIGAAERDGTPHSEEEEEEEEETHPTPTKEAQTTPVGIADPPHDHDGGAFAQRVGFGRQRCLTID